MMDSAGGDEHNHVVTFAESALRLAPRSLWFEGLRRRCAPRPVDEWLVEEANVRGHWGASGRDVPSRSPDPSLRNEELIVALLSPHATVDGRVLKLVVRMLQRPAVDAATLQFLARREAADGVIYWLCKLVPEAEVTPAIAELRAREPRGYRPPRFRYDPARLLRRPASKSSLWRTHPS